MRKLVVATTNRGKLREISQLLAGAPVELLTLADRILVLAEGRLTGEFLRGEATEARIMEAATAR